MPLCRQGRTKHALTLALLFGVGLTVTLTAWGVAIAALGGFLGLRETARYLSIAGGVVSYVLGLWTLRLVRFPLPSGSASVPTALLKRSEHLGAFALGLLLGNMGLCCPDPMFLSLIPVIATGADVAGGGILAASYGLGRATPLVGLVVLAASGVDALRLVNRHKASFDRVVGWGLVAVGTLMVSSYSNVSHDRSLAAVLMAAPVLVYHARVRSSASRAAAWLFATVAGTAFGMATLYWMLLHLP